jgi:hypothetical protein
MASLPNAGAGWFYARKKIEEGYKDLEKAYDEKYHSLIQSLAWKVDSCETTAFHNPDWYERFGFI